MNNLFLFDVDSTLINQEVIELIASHANVQQKVKEITDRAMAGEIDFEQSLTERVSLLTGLNSSTLAAVKSEVTLTDGASELISTLQAQGDHVAIVSGGFVEVISDLMKKLQIEDYKANTFEIENGSLTGKVTGSIVDRNAKADFLLDLKKKYLSTPSHLITLTRLSDDYSFSV